eukprot:1900368-Pyramimonas_sp.AAC.1
MSPKSGQLVFCTWNARAFLRWRGAQAMAKANYLHRAGIASAIFAIQEVHQTLAEFQFVMSRIAPSSS